jgi:hypothetical protein
MRDILYEDTGLLGLLQWGINRFLYALSNIFLTNNPTVGWVAQSV